MSAALDNVEELHLQRFWLDVKQKWRRIHVRNESKRFKQAANVYIHETGFWLT